MGASAALIPQTAMEFQAAAQKNVAALQTRAAGIHCPPTANDGPSAAYTLGTPLEAIASDPAGAAVINRDIPGLLSDPSYSLIKGMSLKAVASLSGGQITDEMLARTEADLKALSKPAPSEP